MQKMIKRFSLFLCLVMCFCSTALNVQAEEDYGIMPLYSYTHNASSNISITSAGKATAAVYCMGYNGEVKKISAKTCIQKKFGLIWTKVNIGTSDNYWYDTTTDYSLATSHSVNLSSSGTYRAKTTYTVYGTDGGTEQITVNSSSATY